MRPTQASGVAGSLLEPFSADDGPWDLLLANLYADLLREVFPDPKLLELLPSGEAILSGIADQHKVALVELLESKGWQVLHAEQDA